MSTVNTVLYGQRAAGVYRLTQIYDPAAGKSLAESGKIVPAIGSQVVDDTSGLHNKLYTVVAVDEITYKSTLVPSSLVIDETSQADRVYSYGNEIFMLYYCTDTIIIEGVQTTLTKLIVDNKLALFGNHAASYQLFKVLDSGAQVVISEWYDAEGHSRGSVIPMLETGVHGIRKCDGCYTSSSIADGDVVICKIYSAAGICISEIQLIARQAHFLSESSVISNPVVGMKIQANQMLADGTLFLYQNQSISELAIYVSLIYANGEMKVVALDNKRGFVYGLQDIRTDKVTSVDYKITVKYYLSDADGTPTSQSEQQEFVYAYALTSDPTFVSGKNYYTRKQIGSSWIYTKASIVVGETVPLNTYYERNIISSSSGSFDGLKFIAKDAYVRVVTAAPLNLSKVSPVPVYLGDAAGWGLNFFDYSKLRTTSPTKSIATKILDDSFNGKLTGVKQTVKIGTTIATGSSSKVIENTFDIEVRSNVSTNVIKWLISDTGSDVVYGDNTPPHVRPRMCWIKNIGYHFSTGVGYFAPNTTQTSEQVFLDNCYIRATPPALSTEAAPPTPTHFLIKNNEGISKSSSLIAMQDFAYHKTKDTVAKSGTKYYLYDELTKTYVQQTLTPGTSLQGKTYYEQTILDITKDINDNQYVNGNVIIEFCRQLDITGEPRYEILYGVPVDVVNG